VGAPADITVLRLVSGNFGFLDARGTRLNGSQKLVAELTIRAGRVVWDLNGLAADNWQSAPVHPKKN
jgi:dihydroorotase